MRVMTNSMVPDQLRHRKKQKVFHQPQLPSPQDSNTTKPPPENSNSGHPNTNPSPMGKLSRQKLGGKGFKNHGNWNKTFSNKKGSGKKYNKNFTKKKNIGFGGKKSDSGLDDFKVIHHVSSNESEQMEKSENSRS